MKPALSLLAFFLFLTIISCSPQKSEDKKSQLLFIDRNRAVFVLDKTITVYQVINKKLLEFQRITNVTACVMALKSPFIYYALPDYQINQRNIISGIDNPIDKFFSGIIQMELNHSETELFALSDRSALAVYNLTNRNIQMGSYPERVFAFSLYEDRNMVVLHLSNKYKLLEWASKADIMDIEKSDH